MQPSNKPAIQSRLRRGTTSQHVGTCGGNGFIGAEGECSYDTDLRVIRIHDGLTIGGFILLRAEPDGSVKLGQFTIGANGTSLSVNHGSANVRWQDGQMQFFDPAGNGWRALGCNNGEAVFGNLVS